MKNQMTGLMIGLLVLGIVLSGCGSKEQHPLVGTWNYSEYMSAQDMAAISGEKMPDGISMSMSISGTITYHADGTRESMGEMSMDMMMMGQQMPLSFNFTDTGTWEVNEDILTDRITSVDFTSDNEITKMMLNQTPEMRSGLEDMVGKDSKSRLVSVSSNQIVLNDLESEMQITLQRLN